MNCPRCNFGLNLIMEKREIRNSDNAIKFTSEYYCLECKSALIEKNINGDHFSSEWIDFNG